MVVARLTGCAAVAAGALSCTQDFDALADGMSTATGTGTTVNSSSSAGGAGAAGGAGGAAGAGGEQAGGMGGRADCPSGPPLKGPPLVAVPASPMHHYCMDAREVSNGEYGEFLRENFTLDPELPECVWNTSGKPAQLYLDCMPEVPLTPPTNHPVVCVDWCDAWEYCRWAGKRLCGKVGAPPREAPFAKADDEHESQWYRACSRANERAYPYGPDYLAGNCNDDSGTDTTAPVTSFPACVGGYDGLLDLSGNVREWEHSCDDTTGEGDSCHQRGGSFESGESELACAEVRDAQRAAAYADVGFRCCLDVD